MRLLLAAYCCSPNEGSEPWAGWSLATAAAADGHDVTVLVEERKFRDAIESHLAANTGDEALSRLRFEFIPEKWWAHGMWAAGLGYRSYRWWQRRAVERAKQRHAEQPFDAVQASTIISFREPGFWSELNIPVIWGPIGGTANVPPAMLPAMGSAATKERLRSWLNRRDLSSRRVHAALDTADIVVAATAETRRDLQAIVPRPVEVVSEIVVPDVVATEPATIKDDHPLRILFSGLHEARKALPLLLNACSRLTIDYELRVLGTGPMTAAWTDEAKRLGVVVDWAGWVDRDTVADHYRWADVFAFPSVRDTTGTVLLEALGSGLPVVGLDHQGVADVVTPACGRTVPVTDPSGTAATLAAALIDLSDASLRADLSAGAIARAADYSADAKRTQWAAIWDRAASLSTQLPRSVTGVSRLKQTARDAKAGAAALAAGTLAAARGVREEQAVGIINYHRVTPHPTPLNVPPDQFERQIRGLVDDGWQGLTVSDLVDAHAAGRIVPRKTFALTFDDAFASVHRSAWPILQELGVPATVYLATRYTDTDRPFPFDPWTRKGLTEADGGDPMAWRSISVPECEDLLADGWELGVHTATHRDFGTLDDAFADDLGESLDWLTSHFGLIEPTFSYPYGLVTPAMDRIVRASGCRAALTTESRLVRPSDDPFSWGRFGAGPRETPTMLIGKLSGWFEAARGVWRRTPSTPSQPHAVTP